jgi:hypothetical protein
MVERNPNDFLVSLNSELQSQASRVRNLIGDAHWLSDGEHKESIVRHLVERYVPDGFEVTSGFAINVENPEQPSKQLDVVVVDRRFEPPLFRRDSFAVVFVTTLVSVISIKSKFTKQSFVDSLDNVISVASLQNSQREKASLSSLFFDDEIYPGDCYRLVKKWCEEDQQVQAQMDALASHPVNFATTSGLLMRFRRKDCESATVHAAFYDCPGLSSAYLIASCMMSASMLEKNSSTDFSTFVTNAFSGTLLGEIWLDAPPKG